MALRLSKRVYTTTALEFWFNKLSVDWERNFKEDALNKGRKIYRSGNIKEVELGDTDAIVHGKFGEFEGYVVLDWEGQRLMVRSSTDETHIGRTLAVAGMYEIEELITDEITPIAVEIKKAPAQTEAEVPAPSEAAGPAEEKEPGVEAPLEKPKPAAPLRLLVLKFNTEERGLAFDVFWLDEKENRFAPALGSKAAPADQITTSERETLIRLASLARKAGFRFRTQKSGYLMEEFERTPHFVRNELPQWDKFFKIEKSDDVDALKAGIHEVEVIAEADIQEGDSLDLQWNMQISSGLLSPEEGRWLMKRGRTASILPGRGLVRLKEQEADTLIAWQENLTRTGQGKIPTYMLFSLFGESQFRLDMTPELSKWKNALLKPKVKKIGGHPTLEILRGYQKYGVQWLSHICDSGCHALLADEMGLGKTLQILSLLSVRPIKDKPSLIVCPASVVPVWQGEVKRFYPEFKVEVLKKGNAFDTVTEPVLWVCSYTQLRRHKALLDKVEFGYVVLDEAQFIKNPEAKVSIACMSIQAAHKIALTGTPLENRFLDIWTLYRFLMPGLLGKRSKFEKELQEDPFGTVERVRKQIAPFLLRRTKKEVTRDLPAKMQSELVCPLTDFQKTEYLRLTTEGIEEFGEKFEDIANEQSFSFLSLLTRLRQCCCDPDLLPWINTPWQNSGKINVLVERLSEIIASNHKVVIFSQFVGMLNRVESALKELFPETPLYRLTGETIDRATPVETFQKQKGAGIILVSLKAGGTGITLHAADYVFLLDPWWNPAVEDQAIDRVHRIGQKNPVFVYRMVTAGTLEARIQQLKEEKRGMFDDAVGSIKSNDFADYAESLTDLIALLPER